VADDDVTEVAGRKIRRTSVSKIVHQHTQETGTDLFGQSATEPTNAEIMMDQEGNVTLPNFKPPDVAQNPLVAQAGQPQDSGQQSRQIEQAKQTQTNEFIALLSDQIAKARRSGNEELAGELKETLTRLIGASTIQRIRKPKQESQVLTKLKNNLGLSRIKPTTIEWANFNWHFHPAPHAVDKWVTAMTSTGVHNFSALKVAAALVGLDDEPLYKVFNVTVVADYQAADTEGQMISVPLYQKFCDSCGTELTLDTEKCPTCSTLIDKFTMPLALRMQCVEAAYTFFQDSFGPYEELGDLYNLMRAVMPDRIVDQATLYPFLEVSRKLTEPTPM
jgi:hypothetical protein